MNDDYSDLHEDSIESLGTEGYCDLAADVLREFHPEMQTYRITDDPARKRFAHVFVMLGDTVLDITGATTLDEILARHANVEGAIADLTTPKAVAEFFHGHGRKPIEHRIVTTRFREHIRANPQQFLLNAKLQHPQHLT